MNRPARHAAVFIARAGGPEVLELRHVPPPQPRGGEVLIAVQAAGVNRHDCNQRRRGPTPVHSDIPGLEVAGTVVGLGDGAAGLALGDAVCALTDGGGYGEYVTAQAAHTLPVPAGLDMVQAAALPEAAFTVWHNFFRVAALQPGESVLLHGGTSGVGTFALQLLAALGHPVYATCGTPDKQAAAERLGARQAFDYHAPTWVEDLRDATEGCGVDVILDMSGGRHTLLNLEALARRGRLVHLSPGDGGDFSAPLRALMAKELKVTGSLLRPLPDDEKAEIASALRGCVWPLVEAGRVRPVVHALLPLAQAVEAHLLMETGTHIGKLVLDVALPRDAL